VQSKSKGKSAEKSYFLTPTGYFSTDFNWVAFFHHFFSTVFYSLQLWVLSQLPFSELISLCVRPSHAGIKCKQMNLGWYRLHFTSPLSSLLGNIRFISIFANITLARALYRDSELYTKFRRIKSQHFWRLCAQFFCKLCANYAHHLLSYFLHCWRE